MYSKPKKIGNLEIKNRFVRSATYEGMATEEGYVTEKLIELYKKLAEGGVGLILTGYTYVQKSGITMCGSGPVASMLYATLELGAKNHV